MKKLIFFVIYLLHINVVSVFAASFAVTVPQKLLTEKASLVLYMRDEQRGQECIGKCQLDQTSALRTIPQCELEMTLCVKEETVALNNMVDLALQDLDVATEHGVVLHFELDSSMKVLRILVVKDSLLEEYPFDVLTIQVSNNLLESQDEFDELSALVANVDTKKMNASLKKQQQKKSILSDYMLYAEIFLLMQYGYAKRTWRDVTNWIYGSK